VEQPYLDCGYVTQEALDEAATLDEKALRLLAAMAITHHDSGWSDSQRDLLRGCTDLLGRKCYWDKA
jgi:hypothetical protein